jgi:hypothetical protein
MDAPTTGMTLLIGRKTFRCSVFVDLQNAKFQPLSRMCTKLMRYGVEMVRSRITSKYYPTSGTFYEKRRNYVPLEREGRWPHRDEPRSRVL